MMRGEKVLLCSAASLLIQKRSCCRQNYVHSPFRQRLKGRFSIERYARCPEKFPLASARQFAECFTHFFQSTPRVLLVCEKSREIPFSGWPVQNEHAVCPDCRTNGLRR